MTLKTELLPHQIVAVNKLKRIKVGALYMEQGTGKTRTGLELIARRYNERKINHVLWLCPLSVKRTIEKELEKHLMSNIDVVTVHGIETLSSSIRANRKLRELVDNKNVYLIVDESNLVKNYRAKRTERITWLAEDCEYKLILNGTPISKNEADLFSQWYILDWRILGYQSFWSFASNHIVWDENIRGKVKDIKNVDYLTRKIAPYTYQITKDECLSLPQKTYTTYYYDMTEDQRDIYRHVADELLFLVDEMLPYTIYRLFAGLQGVISGFNVWIDNDDKMQRSDLFLSPKENPRIKKLLELVDADEDKTIIFCKYTKEVDDIVNLLNDKYGQDSALPFNGGVKQIERQENLLKFENEVRFLVANKVTAGYGLNLQFAKSIIFYNNDWDYATRAQAEDRIHRIGQTSEVEIIDICAKETLDERILDNLMRKENLVDSFKRTINEYKDDDKLEFLKEWLDGKENNHKRHQQKAR